MLCQDLIETMHRESLHRRQCSAFTILVGVVCLINLAVAMTYSLSPPAQPQEARVDSAVDTSLSNFVSRSAWDDKNEFHLTPKRCGAKHVAIIQTDTELCEVFESCATLLNEIEREAGALPYNFVLTPDGYIYEVLGWNEPSPMFVEVPTMVVAFLGTYVYTMPTDEQLNQLHTLLSKAEELQFLAADYIMFGKKTKDIPVKLFECLAPWSQWDFANSDSGVVYVDNVPYYVYEI